MCSGRFGEETSPKIPGREMKELVQRQRQVPRLCMNAFGAKDQSTASCVGLTSGCVYFGADSILKEGESASLFFIFPMKNFLKGILVAEMMA